jgi:chaperonin cofactor prefoldin
VSDGFYLGGVVDPKTGERADDLVDYDPSDLTTHGLIVGMTGSGKTGLGIIYLEEALRAGIPALILDPKGDMTNLLLNFPDLLPSDFEPWIDEGGAKTEGMSTAEMAEATAELWKNGLAGWELGPRQMRDLRDGTEFTIYTPGSQAGVPVNVVGSLVAPEVDYEEEAEALRDEIEGFTSGLLGLAGIEADPLSSREHILVSNLIEHAWAAGKDLDLATLLGQIQQPPMRKLGVFELDAFFPEKDRTQLAMRLNALVASPSFGAWLSGPPLDIGSMLWDPSGKPRAAIVYVAHLSDEERQFIVTLALSKVVTWMRTQGGSGELRALVYMDEVFGFAPPTAEPPAKKPILTLLKQARAFGVGMLLSTQNPVDLDYKAMSNSGTWCIGRLQTERDKARILEGLESASGGVDIGELDKTISGLAKRQFVLHSTRHAEPTIFTTRWAMSYLRGPLTKDQVEALSEESPVRAEATAQAEAADSETATATEIGDDETPTAPPIAEGTAVSYLDPAAPWAPEVGAEPGGKRLAPGLAARVQLVFDDSKAKIDHKEVWEAVAFPLTVPFDVDSLIAVDYDDRDFRSEEPEGAVYHLPEASVDKAAYFRGATTAIKEYLYRERAVTVFRNPVLNLYSRVGETMEEFEARCDAAAQDGADAEVAKSRDRLETKMDRLRDQARAAEARVEELSVDVQTRRQSEILDGAGKLLGSLLGGRRSSRAISGLSTRRGQTKRTEQRLATAEDKLAAKLEDLQELEQDAVLEIEEINDAWKEKADEIEEIEIGLEKTDIHVENVAVVWIPTG